MALMQERTYWQRLQRSRLSRRALLNVSARAGVGAAGLALVGCGGDDDDAAAVAEVEEQAVEQQAEQQAAQVAEVEEQAAEQQAAQVAEEEQPAEQVLAGGAVRGGTFNTWLAGDPTNLDPFVGTSFTTEQIAAFSYSQLMRQKAGPGIEPTLGEVESDLIETFEIVDPDGLEYITNLRRGVMFHPPVSREYDAEDLQFSMSRFRGEIAGTAAHAQSPDFDWLAGLEAVESHTVRWTLNQPRGLMFVTDPFYVFQMPRETGDLFDPSQQLVGTGPWIMDSYQTGVAATFRSNPDWHIIEGGPYVDGLVINFIPEYATRLTQFQAGNLDWLDVQGQDLERVLDNDPETIVDVRESFIGASYISYSGTPESQDKPWQDPRVRQAVSMTLDRDGMLEAAYNVSGVQALGIDMPLVWNTTVPALERPFWLDPQRQFQYKPSDPQMSDAGAETFRLDIAGAKQRLDAAGYPDGFETVLSTTTARYGEPFNIMTELIAVFAQEAGIELTLRPQDYSSDYIITTAVGNHPGLAHIPRGAGAVGQYEHYYPPGAVRNNSILSHSAASDPVLNALLDTMLQTRDFEEHRLAILEAQEYEAGWHYFTPSQQGAAGTFLAFQSNMGNVTDYVVRTNSLNAALEYPHYFKRA